MVVHVCVCVWRGGDVLHVGACMFGMCAHTYAVWYVGMYGCVCGCSMDVLQVDVCLCVHMCAYVALVVGVYTHSPLSVVCTHVRT